MALGQNIDETGRTTFQKSVAILKPKENKAIGYYLFCLLKNEIKELIELASGTSQSNLLLGDLRSFVVKYPGYESVKIFSNTITPIFQNIHLNNRENLLLLKTKDLLLSKMSKVESLKTAQVI